VSLANKGIAQPPESMLKLQQAKQGRVTLFNLL